MQDTTKTYLAMLGAVVLTLGGMHLLISQPAERRAEQRFERVEARLDKMDERFDVVSPSFSTTLPRRLSPWRRSPPTSVVPTSLIRFSCSLSR